MFFPSFKIWNFSKILKNIFFQNFAKKVQNLKISGTCTNVCTHTTSIMRAWKIISWFRKMQKHKNWGLKMSKKRFQKVFKIETKKNNIFGEFFFQAPSKRLYKLQFFYLNLFIAKFVNFERFKTFFILFLCLKCE